MNLALLARLGTGVQMIALWDLGNVVVQWNPDKILQRTGLPANRANLLRQHLFESELWLDLDRGVTDEETVAAEISALSDLQPSELFECFDIVRESLTDLPESVELIQQMHSAGIPLYVLSNMSLVNAQYLRGRPYFELFNGVVISAEEKMIKPDPALFELVLKRYDLKAVDVVFIDDSEPNIDAAKSLGINTVHFKSTDQCYAKVRSFFSELAPG